MTSWSHDLGAYHTEGPGQFVGVEVECDGIRGVDCLIIKGASHTHHNPDDVFTTKEEADENTARREERRARHKALRERLNAERVAGQVYSSKTSHNKGDNPWVDVTP